MRSRAAWRRSDLDADQSWILPLGDAHRAELLDAIERPSAGTPHLDELLDQVSAELATGRGVAFVRGVPIEDLDDDRCRALFTFVGSKLGTPVGQNTAGELMTDIKDIGNDPQDSEVRLYTTAAEQDFHTDGADLIGLLCLKTAKSGGLSQVVSSVTVYEEIAATRPDLAELLSEEWHFFLNTLPDGTHLTFPSPIARLEDGDLLSFFIPWYIRRAQGLPGVPPLTDAQDEALRLYEWTANRSDLCIDMDFRPGDMQWIRNAVVLHKRTAYEDWPDPVRRRHLLRLWLANPTHGGVPHRLGS